MGSKIIKSPRVNPRAIAKFKYDRKLTPAVNAQFYLASAGFASALASAGFASALDASGSFME